jgi:ATP/maltotriose-dependent transcriptional regulator MalT
VLIEASIRCGDRAVATAALQAAAPGWLACQTPRSLGLLARSQALLADDAEAEAGYRLSIERLGQCQVAPELARSHLLYGEWLRRQRRRRGAREQLLTTQETQIARLAAAGVSNRDIATQLFLSTATIDYHLRKIYRKLDVTRRGSLPRARLDVGLEA